MSSRYYNPKVGRFLNADAFTSTGQGLLGNNMHAYCNSNPVRFSDHLGNACVDALRRGGERMPISLVGGAGSILLVEGIINLFKSSSKETNGKQGEEKDTKKGNNSPQKPEPQEPDVKFPGHDPEKAPDGYEWKGPDPQGGKRGGYKNPNGKDSWHPDLNHPDGVDPHWDYNDTHGHKWRVFQDHIDFVK